jgi:imidazolonepropionase
MLIYGDKTMADLVIKNGRIITCKGDGPGPKISEAMDDVGVIENGFVAVSEGRIEAVSTGDGRDYISDKTHVIDAEKRLVMPGLVDSHTHLIHYGSRENELMLKLQGKSYLEILKSGGGILSTVRDTRAATKEMLIKKAKKSLDVMLSYGTTTIEAKSGYGLNFEDEVKCLEVAKDMNHVVDIVSTYMGAHSVPEELKSRPEEYINLMINKVIPYVAENGLCKFIDCFCEEGVFTIDESRKILIAGAKHGLGIKLHADEIEPMGGANLAAEVGAISAEHLLAASDDGLMEMREKGVIAVLLPATSFYLRLGKYARGKEMIKMGIPVAIATDYNPGSSPTESLQGTFVFASMGMGLTPQQVINSVTINAAYAIDKGNQIGSLEKGKMADILIMDAPNENYIVYHFGINHVKTVIKNGRIVINR